MGALATLEVYIFSQLELGKFCVCVCVQRMSVHVGYVHICVL